MAETLTLLAADRESLGKKLRGRLEGLWSARVGNYRVLYTVEGVAPRQQVVVRSIRHQGVAYRRRRR